MSYVNKRRPFTIPVPWRAQQDVGLGDIVARATKTVGIKPCAPCKKRQAALNRLLAFRGKPFRGA